MKSDDWDGIDLWHYERSALERGFQAVAGIDEAGRGPLAGPVVAACVILPFGCDIEGIFDSKELTPEKRESAFEKILRTAHAVGIGVVNHDEIDHLNILRATWLAMRRSVLDMGAHADLFLIDGFPVRDFEYPHLAIVDGDRKSASIAAASIVAKVTRDRIMCQYDQMYPQYGFAKHKGYATREHIRNLATHGVCEIHRKTFAPVAKELSLLWERQELLSASQERKEP